MTTSKIATAFKTATFALAAGAVALGLASPADAAAGTMYGDPAAAAKYWRQQTYDDCVLMSAADVIGQVTGREPSERAIIKVAQSTPSVVHPGSIYTKPADAEHPNSGMGTSVADIPTLLAHYGVDAVITDEDHATATGVATGMAALEQYLGVSNRWMPRSPPKPPLPAPSRCSISAPWRRASRRWPTCTTSPRVAATHCKPRRPGSGVCMTTTSS